MNKIAILLGLLSISYATYSVNPIVRSKVNINDNWEYLENNTKSPDEAIAINTWKNINLPHSWNALDATDITPGYRRSASWYSNSS